MSLVGNVKVGDIVPGRIVRITDYGAFCEIDVDEQGPTNRPIRGLIHISQLATTRVENVEDVVSNDDSVWVKILNISEYDEATPTSSSATRRHPSHHNRRHKVSLSLKDASQDGSRRDLAKEETNEKDQRLKTSTQMESSLNSTIGMGLARDPMDPMAQRILLKQDKNIGSGPLIINGYSLVDDTEGEPLPPPITELDSSTRRKTSATDTTGVGFVRAAPMGRGRGATLPAWMTQSSQAGGGGEGPTGVRMPREPDTDEAISDDGERHSRHHRRREKKKRKEHKRKDRKHRSSPGRDRHRRRHRRHKHSKHDRRKARRKERDEWSDASSRSSRSRGSSDSLDTERDRTASREAGKSSVGNRGDRKRSLSPCGLDSNHGANDEDRLGKQRGTGEGDSIPLAAKEARYYSGDQSESSIGVAQGYHRSSGDSKSGIAQKRYKRQR